MRFRLVCLAILIVLLIQCYGHCDPWNGTKMVLGCKYVAESIGIPCTQFGTIPGGVDICDSPLSPEIKYCVEQKIVSWSIDEIALQVNLTGLPLPLVWNGTFYVTTKNQTDNGIEVETYPFASITLADFNLDGSMDGKDIAILAASFKPGDGAFLQLFTELYGR